MTEKHPVTLVVFVAQLSHILVDNAVLFGKVNNVHVLSLFSRTKVRILSDVLLCRSDKNISTLCDFNFFNLKKVVFAQNSQ